MYIYLPYYRQVCKKPHQVKVLDTVENHGETKRFRNDSGKVIVKHKTTLGQFSVLNVGLVKY